MQRWLPALSAAGGAGFRSVGCMHRMAAIIIQLLIGGVLLGGLYALIAFGLSLIYGVARVLNFAHGTLLAIAGVAASVMFAAWQLNPVLIAAILFPIFFGFGWLMYVYLLEPLKARNPSQMVVGTVLVTVGLLLILSDLGALLAGPTSKNIRLDLQIFQVMRHHRLHDRALHPARHRGPHAGAAPDPDADLVRSRGALGDAGPGGRAAVRGAGGHHSRRDGGLRLAPSSRSPACSTR